MYVLEGHGEAELPEAFSDQIEKENMELTTFSLLTEDSVPEEADCVLIYAPASDISREEKDRLSRLLEKEIFQHPLTLKLLGKAGTYYFGNWDYLEEELQNNWNDVAEESGLIDMYRGLYRLADIGETGSQLARMFALLPSPANRTPVGEKIRIQIK